MGPQKASKGCTLPWTNERPTDPGWWWYRDADDRAVPVLLDWYGFHDDPHRRNLSVYLSADEDQELPGTEVADMYGQWLPLSDVPK